MALISDWKKRCLLCMKDAPAKIPVFGSNGHRKSVRKLIAEFLNVTVRDSDNYPRQICEKCYDTLQKINELKGSAHETLKLLRNLHLGQKEQEEGKAEYIRLWLGSQRTEEDEIFVIDQQTSSNQQQQNDVTCSSMSANEATSSLSLNISAAVSENSDALNNSHMVSSGTPRQGKSERGKKRPGTPIPFSTLSSRSCSPQPGSLPPESSRKHSAARSQSKNRSKIPVQQNRVNGLPEKDANHSGSPQPGSLPPETTGKGSGARKRSKNFAVDGKKSAVQSKGNNPVPEESAVVTVPEENALFTRSQSCSPPRSNAWNGAVLTAKNRKRHKSQVQEHRPRGRPRSRSVPPIKRSKTEPNETTLSRSTSRMYLNDNVCFDKITVPFDLKQFKKCIPIVKLKRFDVPGGQSVYRVPQLPLMPVEDFTLVQEIWDERSEFMIKLCCICNKKFPSKMNAEEHLMEYKNKLSFGSSSRKKAAAATAPYVGICNLCHTQFSTSGALKRHLKLHSEKKWSHKCMQCGETFRTSVILERHMKNHNIRCQVCDVVFTTAQDLEIHSRCHMQQRSLSCSCCKQEFSSEDILRNHVVQHKKCTLCNMTFMGKNELVAHVSERHKVCNICNEPVADDEELESHIDASHKKCNLCGEQFLGEEELDTHLSEHPFQCVLCLSAFNDKAERTEHFKESHPDMLELLKETMAKQYPAA